MNFSHDIIEWCKSQSNGELGYISLIVILFILPRVLLRFGIPMALTSFVLGVATNFSLNFYDGDSVIPIFSTLGIVALFLFAGLEVDLQGLRRSMKTISTHIGIRVLVIWALASIFTFVFKIDLVPAVVLALAVSTPSTGFILDSVATAKIPDNQKYWIKIKAISAELVALGPLLVLSQLNNLAGIIGAIVVITIMIIVLPVLMKNLSETLEKLTPGSEFGFILMLAIISGIITKKLGAYYLVGAFIVGIIAGQYRRQSPSTTSENFLYSVRSFSAFFMPFYFFNSGLNMSSSAFSLDAIKIALILMGISIPLKLGTVFWHRRMLHKENWRDSLSISISLLPNLIFGLVLAEILSQSFNIEMSIYGGLVLYTLFITILSPLLLMLIPNTKELNHLLEM